jgi:hypothetical protein
VAQISFLHLYCDVCHRVLYFTCSSCSMNTDERIHVYCRNTDTVNYDGTFLQGVKKLVEKPNSSHLIMDKNYVNTQRYIQNQINDEIKCNSINLSTSYWNNVFESIKMVNSYWTKIFSININNSSKVYWKDKVYDFKCLGHLNYCLLGSTPSSSFLSASIANGFLSTQLVLVSHTTWDITVFLFILA